MPLDPSALGATSDPRTVRWDADTCSLYALGVGAGTDELDFVTENTRGVEQRTLPTMPVILGMDTRVLKQAGRIDWTRLVHGAQGVELVRELPPTGTAQAVTRIAELWDKGSAAVVVLETSAADDDGPLFTSRTSLFLKGAGGWGGERGPSSSSPVPDRAPDVTVTHQTREDQALLYRLSGDHNPLHSDPAFARKAGFDRPILHGLCTFGFAGRAVLHAAVDGDPSRVTGISARFAAPVYPGEELRTDLWDLHQGTVTFRTSTGDDRVVLDGGVSTTT